MPTPRWVTPSLLVSRHGCPAALLQNDAAGRVDVVPLAEHGRTPSGRAISCTPVMPPAVVAGGNVRRNRAGDLLLVLGAAGEVWLIRDPPLGQERTTLAPAVARCDALGGLLASAVVDAQFHPLSDHHVIVLSADGLRAYDVRGAGAGSSSSSGGGGLQEPSDEWLFAAGAPLSSRSAPPTAFTFGAPRGWELLTVFVLCSDGSLHYVCPLLPAGVLLPAADWQELYDDVAAVAAGGEGGPRSGGGGSVSGRSQSSTASLSAAASSAFAVDFAPVALRWLSASFADVPRQPAWRRYTPPDADLQHGRFARGRVVAALQGPVAFAPELPSPSSGSASASFAPAPAAALAVLPPAALSHTALVMAFGDGRCVSVCSTEPILPAWGRPRAAAAGGGGGAAGGGGSYRGSDELPCCAPGELIAGGGGSASGSGVPWLVTDAVDLGLGHPLAVAAAAVASGGAAFAGGAQGEGVASTASGVAEASARRGTAAAVAEEVDVVHVPRLLVSPAHPSAVIVASRHAVHVLWAEAWTNQLRRVLAGDLSSLRAPAGRAPSQVFRLFSSAVDDIVGLCVDEVPGGGGGGLAGAGSLLLWTVPANTRAAAATGPCPGELQRLALPFLGGGVAELLNEPGGVGDKEATPHETGTADGQAPFAQISADFAATIARATADVARICAAPSRPAASAAAAAPAETPSAALAAAAEGLQKAIAPLLRVRHATHARARQLIVSAAQAEATTRKLAEDAATVQTAATASYERLATLSAHAGNLRARSEAAAFSLSLLNGTLSRAERGYAAALDGMDAELTTHIPTAIARIQRLLEGVAAGTSAAGSASLAAAIKKQQHGAGAALDQPRLQALMSEQAATQESLARSMARLAELKAAVADVATRQQLQQQAAEESNRTSFYGPAGGALEYAGGY